MVTTCGTSTVSLSVSVAGLVLGPRSASTSAVLSTWPASMSAWVDGYGWRCTCRSRPDRAWPSPAGQVTVDRRVGDGPRVRVTLPVFSTVEGVADGSPGLARPAAPSRSRSSCLPCRCSMVTTWGRRRSRCRVGGGLALGRGRVDVGGVVDLAGVDVGLGRWVWWRCTWRSRPDRAWPTAGRAGHGRPTGR